MLCLNTSKFGLGKCRQPAKQPSKLIKSNKRLSTFKIRADAEPEPEPEKKDKKFITREEEPEEYWKSAAEKAGKSPLQDPLALIGILSIFFPFIFLLIAIGTGVIDLSAGKFR
eukprot:TRINITY_DN223_c0_g1_i1.p2 TRINITY_DN223_c0_g1~~TRINITY_DN223_c0_g1_i1.p2  ORF type:complete len:113 (-),score=18.57 TRINITY_DN223_c0_g1_i1:233-571(-)